MDRKYSNITLSNLFINNEKVDLNTLSLLSLKRPKFIRRVINGLDTNGDGTTDNHEIDEIIKDIHDTSGKNDSFDINNDGKVLVNDVILLLRQMRTTPTPSETPEATPTPSMTNTISMTPTITLTEPTPTPSMTVTPTVTVTEPTPTPTVTLTESMTPTPSVTITESLVNNIISIDDDGVRILLKSAQLKDSDRGVNAITLVINNITSDITSSVDGSSITYTQVGSQNKYIITVDFAQMIKYDETNDDLLVISYNTINDTTYATLDVSDYRNAVSDQFGNLFDIDGLPSASFTYVSGNEIVVAIRPYTIEPHTANNKIVNFQFDFEGVKLKKLKGTNPLPGYSVSVGDNRVIVFTMQVEKNYIDLNDNKNILLSFECSEITLPKIKSAMFVDTNMHIAGYQLYDNVSSATIRMPSIGYQGFNGSDNKMGYLGAAGSSVTANRNTFYYGDLIWNAGVDTQYGSQQPLVPVTDFISGGSSLVTVQDVQLALRMFVNPNVYNGTEPVVSGDENTYVTDIQRVLVYANDPSTTVPIDSDGTPKDTFALSNLKHILKIVSLALGSTDPYTYSGVYGLSYDSGTITVNVTDASAGDKIVMSLDSDTNTSEFVTSSGTATISDEDIKSLATTASIDLSDATVIKVRAKSGSDSYGLLLSTTYTAASNLVVPVDYADSTTDLSSNVDMHLVEANTSVYRSGSSSMYVSSLATDYYNAVNLDNMYTVPRITVDGNFYNAHTLMCWVNMPRNSDSGIAYGNILSCKDYATTSGSGRKGYLMEFWRDTDDSIWIAVLGTNFAYTKVSDIGDWVFIALTVNPSNREAKFYYRAANKSSMGDSGENPLTTNEFTAGNDKVFFGGPVPGNSSNGSMYYNDIKVFDKILTSDEIEAYYDSMT